MIIDSAKYDKSRLPVGTGYDRRPIGRTPSTLIIHSTNGKRGSLFESEARFVYSSPNISAHYLVGKSGQVVQFLEPAAYRAWHAGVCIPEYNNARSIGIECHHTVGELWTPAQRVALTALVRMLVTRFNIPAKNIETHRRVALPPGRKVDPSDWSDLAFYAWRETIMQTQLSTFRVRLDTQIGATVRAQPHTSAERLMNVPAGTLLHGKVTTGELVTLPGFGQSPHWLALEPNGYIWLPLLETISQG